jgi:hypothetical protein
VIRSLIDGNNIKVKSEYAQALKNNGYVVGAADENGMIAVEGVKIIVSNDKEFIENIATAKPGDVIVLAGNITVDSLVLTNGVSIDLNGKTLTAGYFVAFKGNDVVDATNGTGLLVVKKDMLSLSKDNANVAVWTGEGYKFASVNMQGAAVTTEDGFKVTFRPSFGSTIKDILAQDVDKTGLQFIVRVSWYETIEDEHGNPCKQYCYQDFVFSASRMERIYSNRKVASLAVSGFTEKHEDVKATIIVTSETGVEVSADVEITSSNQ